MLSPLVTPTRIRPLKRARQQLRNRSPTLAREPEPYYNLMPLSPYIFDADFYNNRDILNGNITPGGATYGAVNNRHAKYIRKIYEEVIDSA